MFDMVLSYCFRQAIADSLDKSIEISFISVSVPDKFT